MLGQEINGDAGALKVRCGRTLLLVYPQYHHDLVPAYSDKLLDRPDTSPRKLGEQDHSLDIVILELEKMQSFVGRLFTTEYFGERTSFTYAPISAIWRTWTLTSSSTSG